MVQWIIAEVMADHEVDPNNVVTRFRRHSVFGWGTFKCTECRLSWSSQITWVTLDIKEQRIRRRFKQKCKKCGQPQRPWWHVEEFAYMMEFALERYQKLVSGTWKPTNRPIVKSDNAPHKSELCERCGFGVRKCWLITNDKKEGENGPTNIKEGDYIESEFITITESKEETIHEDSILPESEDSILLKPEDNILPEPEDGTLLEPEDSTLPEPEDSILAKPEDSILAKPEDSTLPEPDEKKVESSPKTEE